MKIGYFDCFSGASGDMILGSMIDAGLSPGGLRGELKKLRIRNVSLKIKKVLRGGISSTQVIVEGKDEKRSHRSLSEMLRLINRSRLEPWVKEGSRGIFRRIESAVAAAIAETGASSAKDMGTVMKAVMPRLAGKNADGKAVNEAVRRTLGA